MRAALGRELSNSCLRLYREVCAAPVDEALIYARWLAKRLLAELHRSASYTLSARFQAAIQVKRKSAPGRQFYFDAYESSHSA